MYNDTVTLFCRDYDRSGSTWYPFVLHSVHLNMDKSAIIAKYGANSEDAAMLNIHYRKDVTDIYVGDKIWKPPIEWNKLPDEDKQNTITFTSGQHYDFIWFGEWKDANPAHDTDYSGNFYQYMRDNYDYVFAITSVGGPYSVIPHFEIMGR